MYILIDSDRYVKPGEVVVIKSDNAGGIGAFLIGGEKIGSLSGVQPEGCLDYWTVASNLFDNRVLCDAVVVSRDSVLLHTESRLFASLCSVKRVETEGYGMTVAHRAVSCRF